MFLKFSSILLLGIVIYATPTQGVPDKEPYYLDPNAVEGRNGEYYDTEVDDDDFELEFPAGFLIAVRKLSNTLIAVLNYETGTGRATVKKIADDTNLIWRHPVSTKLFRDIAEDVHETLTNSTAQNTMRKIVKDTLKFHQVISLHKFTYSIRNLADAFSEPQTLNILSSIFNEIMSVSSSERRIDVLNALISAASDSKESAAAANQVDKPQVQSDALNVRNFYKTLPPIGSTRLHSE